MADFTKFWQLFHLTKEERKKQRLFYLLLKRFFYTYSIIAGIIIVASIFLNIVAIKDGDFQNWTSFLWELGLSAYLAIAILTYENFQKEKDYERQKIVENLVRDIKNISEAVQKTTEKQEEFFSKKRDQAYTGLNGNIFALRFSVRNLEREFDHFQSKKISKEQYLEQIRRYLPHVINCLENLQIYCVERERYIDEGILNNIHRLLVEGNLYCEKGQQNGEFFNPTLGYQELITQTWSEIPDPHEGYGELRKRYGLTANSTSE